MNISKIQSTIPAKPTMFAKVLSSKPIKNTVVSLGEKLPLITVISVVSKDLVGALILFYQTYHNKLIPEKKRKYLASYELTSGAYNVAFPLTVGLLLDSASFKHKTARAAFKKYYVKPEVLEKAKIDSKKAAGALKEEALKILSKNKTFGKCNDGLSQFINLIFVAIVSKRIICPFVGGPLATIFNKNVLQKNEDKLDRNKKIDKTPAKQTTLNKETAAQV